MIREKIESTLGLGVHSMHAFTLDPYKKSGKSSGGDHGDEVNAARLIISTRSNSSELVVHRGTRTTRAEEVKLVYSSDTFSVTNATLTSKYQTIAKHRAGVNFDQKRINEKWL